MLHEVHTVSLDVSYLFYEIGIPVGVKIRRYHSKYVRGEQQRAL